MKPDAMEPNRQNHGPTPEERQMLRNRWQAPQRNLPPPEELERVQVKLITAAKKGKAEFNRVWNELFHGKYPSPGKDRFLPNPGGGLR